MHDANARESEPPSFDREGPGRSRRRCSPCPSPAHARALFGVHWMLPGWLQWRSPRRCSSSWERASTARPGRRCAPAPATWTCWWPSGTSAAYFLSVYLLLRTGGAGSHLYFEASAVVVTLVLLGKWLEGRAKHQTTAAIRALAALRPASARVLKDGASSTSASSVRVGDLVVVRPGERVPVDAVIVEGDSHVDESLITGESLPSAKGAGRSRHRRLGQRRGLLRRATAAWGPRRRSRASSAWSSRPRRRRRRSSAWSIA